MMIVAAKQDARFLIARDGILEEAKVFRIEKRRYSDREGHFKVRGHGIEVSSGAVYEEPKEAMLRDFLARFIAVTKDLLLKYDFGNVIIFIPENLKKLVINALPSYFQKKISAVFYGNYFKYHPFKLLEKMKTESSNKIPPSNLKPEAKKILDRPKKTSTAKI